MSEFDYVKTRPENCVSELYHVKNDLLGLFELKSFLELNKVRNFMDCEIRKSSGWSTSSSQDGSKISKMFSFMSLKLSSFTGKD